MPLMRPGIDDNTQHPRYPNGKATSEEEDVRQQMEAVEGNDSVESVKNVVAGGVTVAKSKVTSIIPNVITPSAGADYRSYRDEVDYNDDGTPNVMAAKE